MVTVQSEGSALAGCICYLRTIGIMFWPLFLPSFITFAILVGAVLLVMWQAPRWRIAPSSVLFWGTLCGVLAFVPSCAIVMGLVDRVRFGVFDYVSFADISDSRVERYLPPAATQITVEKRQSGFRARFRISENDLNTYLDADWKSRGNTSPIPYDQARPAPDTTGSHEIFSDLNWPPMVEVVRYQGPLAPNGAGFTIWYSSPSGIAYERASYW